MSTYVVTVPGTFQRPLTEEARSRLLAGLRPADPRQTRLGAVEDLDILTVDSENSTFSLRLEVEADNSRAAEEEARNMASRALLDAGYTIDTAPLGDPVITGIDAE